VTVGSIGFVGSTKGRGVMVLRSSRVLVPFVSSKSLLPHNTWEAEVEGCLGSSLGLYFALASEISNSLEFLPHLIARAGEMSSRGDCCLGALELMIGVVLVEDEMRENASMMEEESTLWRTPSLFSKDGVLVPDVEGEDEVGEGVGEMPLGEGTKGGDADDGSSSSGLVGLQYWQNQEPRGIRFRGTAKQ
jgi:hypothetical protein